MEEYSLTLEEGDRKAIWRLRWDDQDFVLESPNGEEVLRQSVDTLYKTLDLLEFYGEGQLEFTLGEDTLTFKKQAAAWSSIHERVEKSLLADGEARLQLRQHAQRGFWIGFWMFLVSGGLFGLYCWFASWAPAPPPGHWVRWFGVVIHGILLLLMGFAAAGPWVMWNSGRVARFCRHFDRQAQGDTFQI